jgi:hypothetical protein
MRATSYLRQQPRSFSASDVRAVLLGVCLGVVGVLLYVGLIQGPSARTTRLGQHARAIPRSIVGQRLSYGCKYPANGRPPRQTATCATKGTMYHELQTLHVPRPEIVRLLSGTWVAGLENEYQHLLGLGVPTKLAHQLAIQITNQHPGP